MVYFDQLSGSWTASSKGLPLSHLTQKTLRAQGAFIKTFQGKIYLLVCCLGQLITVGANNILTKRTGRKSWGKRSFGEQGLCIALTSSWEFKRPHACSVPGTCSEKTWADPPLSRVAHLQAPLHRLKQSCKLPGWVLEVCACPSTNSSSWSSLLLFLLPVPVISVTKFSRPLPWPNFLSAMAAQLPSLSTHTGRCKVSDRGVLRSTEFHSWISLVECSTIPSRGFTRPPVDIPELPHKHKENNSN